MNQQQWNEGLDHMDEDLLRNYLTAKDQYVHKRRNRQRFFHVARDLIFTELLPKISLHVFFTLQKMKI